MERSGRDSSIRAKKLGLKTLNGLLTWVLHSERGASVVIVKHVGGEGPLELISVDVLHNFLFRLLFLLLPGGAFGGAAARASGGCNSRFVFFRGLVLVSAAGLRLLYKKVPWRAASVKSRSGKFSPRGKYFPQPRFPEAARVSGGSQWAISLQ